MSELNPYAAPTAGFPPGALAGFGAGTLSSGDTNARRAGDALVMPARLSVLPDRCVVCNAPACGHKLKRELGWHPPWVYLTIFAGFLIYLLVALATRKTASVELGLCQVHRVRRRNGLILGWAGFLGSFALLFVGAFHTSSTLLLASIAGMLVFPIFGGVMARVASPAKIDDHQLWLKVGQPYLDSFPER